MSRRSINNPRREPDRTGEHTGENTVGDDETGPVDATSLEEVVRRIDSIDAGEDPVTVATVLQQLGRRSFGAMLLFAGLVVLAPLIGDIPGVPTLMAALVAITAIQMLMGRRWFWLPEALLRRAISRASLDRGVKFAYRPARFADRFLRQRLEIFTSRLAGRTVAGAALAIALIMPVLELIPFSANLAGIALAAFGVSLIARDGLFALISMIVTAGTFGLVVYSIDKL
jgi:hypothetical protein